MVSIPIRHPGPLRSALPVPPLCFLGAECRWEMRKATPEGLAEQAARQREEVGRQKAKKTPPLEKNQKNCQNRQPASTRWRKGGDGGKAEVAEGSAEYTATAAGDRSGRLPRPHLLPDLSR